MSEKTPEVGPVFAALMQSSVAQTMSYLLENSELTDPEMRAANERISRFIHNQPLKDVLANWICMTRNLFYNIQESGLMVYQPDATTREAHARNSSEFH